MKGVVKLFKLPSPFSAVYGQGKDAPAVYNPCKTQTKYSQPQMVLLPLGRVDKLFP